MNYLYCELSKQWNILRLTQGSVTSSLATAFSRKAAGKVVPMYENKVCYIIACRYISTPSKRLFWIEMCEQLHTTTVLLQSPSGCCVEDKKGFMPLPRIEPYFFGRQATVPAEISPFPQKSLLSIPKVKLYITTV